MKFNELNLMRQLHLAADIGNINPDELIYPHSFQPYKRYGGKADACPKHQELKLYFGKHYIDIDKYRGDTELPRVFMSPTIGWALGSGMGVKLSLLGTMPDGSVRIEIQVRISEDSEIDIIKGVHTILETNINSREDLSKIKEWFRSHELEPRINDAIVAMVDSFEEALETADAITDIDWSLIKKRESLQPTHNALNRLLYTRTNYNSKDMFEGDTSGFNIHIHYLDTLIIENGDLVAPYSMEVRYNEQPYEPVDTITVIAKFNQNSYPSAITRDIPLDMTAVEYIDVVIDAVSELGNEDAIVLKNIQSIKDNLLNLLVSAKPAIDTKIDELKALRSTTVPFSARA